VFSIVTRASLTTIFKLSVKFSISSFFLLSFSIAEKETILQGRIDKKKLPRSWPTLARIFVGLTLASQQAFFFPAIESV
jgi:hypothetical protein